MFEPKWRFNFNVGLLFMLLIIITLGFAMIKTVLAQDEIWVPPDVNGVCTGTQTCYCSGKPVDCPCDADPCVICGPTSPECEQANPAQPAIPESARQYTPARPAVPNGAGQANPAQPIIPPRVGINDFFNLNWWKQIPTNFIYNIRDLWSIFINKTLDPIWCSFTNNILHNGWCIRRCTSPVFAGNTHICSDCNKIFEQTAITGPYSYKGVCNVDNVNGNKCRIINCKK